MVFLGSANVHFFHLSKTLFLAFKKNPLSILCCAFCNLFYTYPFYLSKFLSYYWNICAFVSFASVWGWCQIWRVCF